ncbi:hypothetical protein [Streptomyces sp. AS58]|uniref:hypothetical protein n=1 Tax=Streptomyces sp. AS58 TaxID=1519489 RepID=UPI000A72FCD6
MATAKCWRIFRHARCSPNRLSSAAKAFDHRREPVGHDVLHQGRHHRALDGDHAGPAHLPVRVAGRRQSWATASGTATSANTTLAEGSHTVAVRAVQQSGTTATTATLTVVADTTAPAFTTTPKLSLGTGTVNSTAVPVTLA